MVRREDLRLIAAVVVEIRVKAGSLQHEHQLTGCLPTHQVAVRLRCIAKLVLHFGDHSRAFELDHLQVGAPVPECEDCDLTACSVAGWLPSFIPTYNEGESHGMGHLCCDGKIAPVH